MADETHSPKQTQEPVQDTPRVAAPEADDQDVAMIEPENVTDQHQDQPASESENEPEAADDTTELHVAARNIDLAHMQKVLGSNPSVNINAKTSENGHTPLWDLVSAAVEYDEIHDDAVACLKLLISHGADVNAQANNGATPLHRCAFSWCHDTSVEIAKVLLDHGADTNANKTLMAEPTPVPSTADGEDDGCECGAHIGTLLKAAYKQATGGQTLELPEQPQEKLVTPIHLAVGRNANLPMAKLLLAHGAKTDINDLDAGTPLHLAVGAGSEAKNLEIISLLLSQPDAPSLLAVPNGRGYLPIHLAAEFYSSSGESKSHEVMTVLLDAGSPVDVPLPDTHKRENRRGLTPLLLVAQNSQLPPSSSGPEPEKAKDKNPPLKTITHLLSLGADATKTGALNQSALLFAILAQNLPLVKYLSTLPNIDLTFIRSTEPKPLHVAALSANPDLISYLVQDANCPINETDSEGYTALIHAAGYAKPKSANLSSEEIEALQRTTIQTLVSLGAEVEARIHDGRRAIHFAAFKGQHACLGELVRQGADIAAVDDNDWTALHFAARYLHKECIRVLLEVEKGKELIGKVVDGGPRPKTKDGEEIDIDGFNAADLARSVRGGGEIVDLLGEYGEVPGEKTKEFVDEDLWEEKGGQCCVM